MTNVRKFLAASVGFCYALALPALADSSETTIHHEEHTAEPVVVPVPVPAASHTEVEQTTNTTAPSISKTTTKSKVKTPIGKVKSKTTTVEADPGVQSTTTRVHSEN